MNMGEGSVELIGLAQLAGRGKAVLVWVAPPSSPVASVDYKEKRAQLSLLPAALPWSVSSL